MKKKFISAMAISLCLCMGAMVGCGDNTNNSSSSSSSSAEPLTQDEVLAKIGEAYEATKAYTGGYTVSGTNNWEYKGFEDEEKETGVGTMELTADPSQKLFYYKQGNEEGYELEKLLKNGADYISYSEEKSGDEEAEKDYTKWTEAYANYYLNENYGIAWFISNFVEEEIFTIESIDAYNAACAKVFADSAAEVEEGKEDEESRFYGWSNASGSTTISAVETEDGAYVLTTEQNMQCTALDYEGQKPVTMTYLYKTVITAKDGKLTGIQEIENTTRTRQVSDTATQTYIEKDETTYTVSYTFDQAKYDGVSVTLPDTVEPRDGDYFNEIKVVINGVERFAEACGNSVQYAMENFKSDVASRINANEQNATVAFYKDAAYTQAIDGATMTEAEFYALEKVYVKVEPKDGYALMSNVMGYAFADDVTAEQKVVFGVMVNDTYVQDVQIVSVAEPIDLNMQFMPAGVKAYINGTVATGNTFTAESGKTYEVKYVMEMAKADCNIFGGF